VFDDLEPTPSDGAVGETVGFRDDPELIPPTDRLGVKFPVLA
jgi:hypothetical protein